MDRLTTHRADKVGDVLMDALLGTLIGVIVLVVAVTFVVAGGIGAVPAGDPR
jgi:hypothetical protein